MESRHMGTINGILTSLQLHTQPEIWPILSPPCCKLTTEKLFGRTLFYFFPLPFFRFYASIFVQKLPFSLSCALWSYSHLNPQHNFALVTHRGWSKEVVVEGEVVGGASPWLDPPPTMAIRKEKFGIKNSALGNVGEGEGGSNKKMRGKKIKNGGLLLSL